MNNLLTSIMSKTIGSTLSTGVGGRIYLDQAPAETEFPYIVFFIVSDTPDYTFKFDHEEVLVQFSIFSTSKSASEISTIYNNLKALFDDCTLSITGNTLVHFWRQNLTTMVDEIETPTGTIGVKHWAVDYLVRMEATS